MPPPAGFNPLCGTSGSIKGVLITPDLTVDLPTSAGTTAALVELAEWRLSVKSPSGRVITFSSPADAQGAVYPLMLRGGIAEWSVQFSGVYNADSGAGAHTYSRLTPNAFVKFDLLLHAVSTYGWKGLMGRISSLEAGTKVGPDPAAVSGTIDGTGLLGAPSFT